MELDNTDISNIRKQFQSTFDDFKSPLPHDGWAQLEASLDAVKTAKLTLRRRLYITSVAAAAVLLLLVGTTLFLQYLNPIVSEVETAQLPDITPDTTMNVDNYYADTQEETFAPHSEPLMAETIDTRPTPQRPTTDRAIELQPEQIEPVTEITTDTPTTAPIRRNRRNNDTNQFQLSDNFILIAANRTETAADLPTQRRRRDNLSVAFGSRGGIAPFYAEVNTPMTLRSATSVEEDEYIVRSEESVINNVSEKEHSQPVSFGVTVSMPIADGLSLETGLVYTLLSSRVRNTSLSVNEQERQRLHYLGIPLNLNYTLFNVNEVNVFASVGGMVEKNIFGTYRRMRITEPLDEVSIVYTTTSAHEMVTERIRQRNPQFSVNAGVGASYPIANRLRLYGRIGGAYYFNARNEHRTIYSDGRIVMNLNIGIRYEF